MSVQREQLNFLIDELATYLYDEFLTDNDNLYNGPRSLFQNLMLARDNSFVPYQAPVPTILQRVEALEAKAGI